MAECAALVPLAMGGVTAMCLWPDRSVGSATPHMIADGTIAATALAGLCAARDEQPEFWVPTHSEEEVALPLPKRLSFTAFARGRHVAETTVHHQAMAVYAMNRLRGEATRPRSSWRICCSP